MGVPIYGIVAFTSTATDREGRSVPAPGQGILTTAREKKGDGTNRLLSFEYRTRQLKRQLAKIAEWVEEELQDLRTESEGLVAAHAAKLIAERTAEIHTEAERLVRSAKQHWVHYYWKNDSRISPLKGALSVWGLTVDDIGVASFHGTGTKANDKNESNVLNSQMRHLGRTEGNLLPSIFQKYLTGHPKGAAAAWMLNGVLQVLQTGIIPGNRNADNIDQALESFEYLIYPSRSLHTDGLKAALLKSFGFGQVGGEVLVLHPDYILAACDEKTYNDYKAKCSIRQAKAYRFHHDSLTGVDGFVRVKTAAPYSSAQQNDVYLDPTVRASYNDLKKTWTFDAPSHTHSIQEENVAAMEELAQQVRSSIAKEGESGQGIGMDVEAISSINIDNETFIERNFTSGEIAYCRSKPDPRASFAGRWCAKEAVIKALSNTFLQSKIRWQGAGAPLKDIEIIALESGCPGVLLHGEARTMVGDGYDIKVTISHSDLYAIAMAQTIAPSIK
jgi:fatty acid synthase subunit alpha